METFLFLLGVKIQGMSMLKAGRDYIIYASVYLDVISRVFDNASCQSNT